MRTVLVAVLLSLGSVLFASEKGSIAPAEPNSQAPTVLLLVGAAGDSQYERSFADWAALWDKACATAGARLITIGLESVGPTNDLARAEAMLRDEASEPVRELWIVMIGHGTFDGKEAKFNLRGPDLSASDLAKWLEPVKRPIVIVDSTSASAPFLNKLSRSGRVVVTATRSGYEVNFARFGQYFSAAIADIKADLDKDGQVSVLEAFLMASHDVAEFYKTEGRLATEHALIDDNGDGLGTPPDWFRGIRAIKKPSEGASLDGFRAHQIHLIRSEAERQLSPKLRERRDHLELSLEQLRQSKEKLAEDEYYQRLEAILLELARVYQGTANPPAEFE